MREGKSVHVLIQTYKLIARNSSPKHNKKSIWVYSDFKCNLVNCAWVLKYLIHFRFYYYYFLFVSLLISVSK